MRLTSIHFFCLTFHKQKKALLPRLCTTICPAFSTSAALASFVSNPRGVTGLLFFFLFQKSPAFLFFKGWSCSKLCWCKWEDWKGSWCGWPGAPCEGDKAYSSTVALAALGSAQMKRGKRRKKKQTEHKAYMLMCQLGKLARGQMKLLHLSHCNTKMIQTLAANYTPRFWILF